MRVRKALTGSLFYGTPREEQSRPSIAIPNRVSECLLRAKLGTALIRSRSLLSDGGRTFNEYNSY